MARLTRIKHLIPDARNANAGTERGTQMLEDSLRKYGAGRSILVDAKGRVIAGNKTLEQAAAIGLDKLVVVETRGKELVAVQRVDLDLEKHKAARELAIADNRIGQVNLEWDPPVLADLSEDLDLSGLFSDRELDILLKDFRDDSGEAPEPQLDKAAELQKKWKTARGQIWEIGKHRLMCGDSAKDVAGAVWYLWHAQMTQGFFAAAAAAAAQVKVHRQIIWKKSHFILGHGDYHWQHELCFYGWREGEKHRWFGDRSQTTIWEIDNPKAHENHPTEKPVEIFARPIQFNTHAGEICYEPFAGSGSQIVAAEQLQRRCYAMEIEPKYVAVALERMSEMGLRPKLTNGKTAKAS